MIECLYVQKYGRCAEACVRNRVRCAEAARTAPEHHEAAWDLVVSVIAALVIIAVLLL